ncbi:MAG: VOC family protein [Sphingomonadales bacterium]|nr:VOC family protein [Sphingomonadales bacterium]
MIRGIHHIGINCRDMDRMVRFYAEAFGFAAVEPEGFAWDKGTEMMDHIVDVKDSASKGIMLRAGTCYLELFQYSNPPAESVAPKRPYDFGYTHFCVDVTEMEKDMAHLKACGMTFNDREFVDVGHVKTLYGYDPEGNVIEVQQTAPGNAFGLGELKPVL